eukprot:gb/GECG01011191.1/.p1 GENE.gb/GECG01011191.1/~~gb/GECG01011191.1/.p1  ORF type:complete len:143 (+),score=15.21 gb/GECG01011191.1/:1-429(+)
MIICANCFFLAQAKQLGYDGKTLIHPSTIEKCNEVFSPTQEEVERALKIVQAYDSASAEGLLLFFVCYMLSLNTCNFLLSRTQVLVSLKSMEISSKSSMPTTPALLLQKRNNLEWLNEYANRLAYRRRKGTLAMPSLGYGAT